MKTNHRSDKGTILVTPRSISQSGHPSLAKLEHEGFQVLTPFPGRQPTADELLSVIPGCVGYLAGVERIGAEIIRRADGLKVISRNGIGVDNIDQSAADEAGIRICTTAGANSRGVAELTIGLMFAVLRFIPQSHQAVKSGGWERIKGREVYKRKIGIIGTGQIGRLVAGMANGLGMEVLAYDLYPNTDSLTSLDNLRYTTLEKLAADSDVVTLHCPAGKRPLVDSLFLDRIKRGAVLINTARSALVDQSALLNALSTGRIAGYAVDAYDTEPPAMTPLYEHPSVVLSSHIGGFTEESVNRATEAAVNNIIKVLAGDP